MRTTGTMLMDKLSNVFIIVIIFSLSAYAQIKNENVYKIMVGERIFEYERIKDNDSTTFGTVYERVSRDDENGITKVEFVQEFPNSKLTDSIILSSRTMIPFRYRSIAPGF